METQSLEKQSAQKEYDSFDFFIENQKYIRGCVYRSINVQDDADISILYPEDIDTSLCNVIFFSGSYLDENFNFLPSVFPDDLESSNGPGYLQRLVKLKITNPWLKIMVSVGGPPIVDYSLFLDMLQSDMKREIFINSTLAYLRENSFDGIDLNWEYPDMLSEKQLLTSFVTQFRQRINDEESTFENRLWISVSAGSSQKGIYDKIKLCEPQVAADFINLKAFDVTHPDSSFAGHPAPLYSTPEDDEVLGGTFSVSNNLLEWITSCGTSKVVLGLPAFGVQMQLLDARHSGFSAPIEPYFSQQISYKSMMRLASISELTQVPPQLPRQVSYAYGDGNWTGFDDEATIALKSETAINMGALGTTMFYLDQDYVGTRTFPLTNSMNTVLLNISNQECPAPKPTNVQIIPQFPQGLWDGADCSQKTLRRLPAECFEALHASSSDAEKLACSLITQPSNQGTIPFGMYPSRMRIDEELWNIENDDLSPVFGECALAQMIHDGCFSYRIDSWPSYYRGYAFATAEGYMRATMSGYNFGIKASAQKVDEDHNSDGLGASLAFNYFAATGQGSSGMYRALGIRREWVNDLGFLSNTCMKPEGIQYKYLNKDYVQLWENITDIGSVDELVNDETFATLAESGFLVPADFAFAIRYSTDLRAVYNSSSVSTANASGFELEFDVILANSSKGFKGTFEASYGQASIEAVTHATVNTSIVDKSFRYGDCNFDQMKTDPGTWNEVFSSCASTASDNLDALGRAAYVSKGGFQNILALLQKIGVRINPYFQDAMNQYFGICQCLPVVQQDSSPFSYNCYDGKGKWVSRPMNAPHCKFPKVWWWSRNTKEFTRASWLFTSG